MMSCFSNHYKLVNHEIKTVVLNTINPMNSKAEWGAVCVLVVCSFLFLRLSSKIIFFFFTQYIFETHTYVQQPKPNVGAAPQQKNIQIREKLWYFKWMENRIIWAFVPLILELIYNYFVRSDKYLLFSFLR